MIGKGIELDPNIEQYEDDWNDEEYSACDHSYLGIDGGGNIQCRDCLCLFDDTTGKSVMACLREHFGEFWVEEWERLKSIQDAVFERRFEQLRLIQYAYRDENGNLKTIRYFYEKAQPD